jgi:hypothetical protein
MHSTIYNSIFQKNKVFLPQGPGQTVTVPTDSMGNVENLFTFGKNFLSQFSETKNWRKNNGDRHQVHDACEALDLSNYYFLSFFTSKAME